MEAIHYALNRDTAVALWRNSIINTLSHWKAIKVIDVVETDSFYASRKNANVGRGVLSSAPIFSS